MKINYAAIPDALKTLRSWVVWKFKPAKTKPTKILCSAITGEAADSTDPETWASYDDAVQCYENHGAAFAGLGFVFSPSDPYCGVDLDDCLDEHSEPYPPAKRLLATLSSYTEISPSGKGVKVWVKAKKPGERCKRDGIAWSPSCIGRVEIYDQNRFFAVTGNVLPDTVYTIEDRQKEITALYGKLFPTAIRQVQNGTTSSVVDRCRKYLEHCPDSITGQGGHDRFLRAACECMRFGLSDSDTLETLRWWSHVKSGNEPWNEREIGHKIKAAREKATASGEIGSRLRNQNNGVATREPVVMEKPKASGASDGVLERFEQIERGEFANVTFPWPVVTKLSQALWPATVTLLCGDPGAGKSFFLINACLHWLTQGVEFQIFMLEEDRTYHLHRALAVLEGRSELSDLDWIKANAKEAKASWARHRETLDAFGARMYASPTSRITLRDASSWYEKVAADNRLAIIDPITMASAGDKRYLEDGEFIERCKRIAVNTSTSLLLVTHPKLGRKTTITLDDLAGGADYPRFTQTIIVLARHDESDEVVCLTPFGRAPYTVNRMVHLKKTRNGRGDGSAVAFRFGKGMQFSEIGMVCADE